MIHVIWTKLPNEYPCVQVEKYFNMLPPPMQERSLAYLRWQDKYAYILGKALLVNLLELFEQDHSYLNFVSYNKFGRPFFSCGIDFNISHSNEYIVCAIGKGIRLGIDVQFVKEIDLKNFETVMTEDQWKVIKRSTSPVKTFFSYWTIKESVIKADGRGLGIPLQDIHVHDKQVHYDEKSWHIYEFDFDQNYCLCLAASEFSPISIQQMK
jgi:4'-phosphopantetheinyl transferase